MSKTITTESAGEVYAVVAIDPEGLSQEVTVFADEEDAFKYRHALGRLASIRRVVVRRVVPGAEWRARVAETHDSVEVGRG